MLVFGTEQVFASPLPMFRPPHDYQVLPALALPDSARQAYARSRHDFPAEAVYTPEPERLVLSEWVQQPQPFRATLYRGHFERGGTPIARNVRVGVRQVLMFRPLAAHALPARQHAFWLLGGPREQFLVHCHCIEGRPSFDQVLRVQVPAGGQPRPGQLVRAWLRPGLNPPPPLPVGPVAGSRRRPGPLTVAQQLYLEFDDLR